MIQYQHSARIMIKRKVMRRIKGSDPAHHFQHIMRVYKKAELIGKREGADIVSIGANNAK